MTKKTEKELKEYKKKIEVRFKQLQKLVGVKNLQEYREVEKECIELHAEFFGKDEAEFFYALSYTQWEKRTK